MSLSLSLGNALSGLTVASKSASVVSSNIANADTDGYGRREVQTTSVSLGGYGTGARVAGVTRDVDARALADRREADAQVARARVHADYYARLEAEIGLPGDSGSLSDTLSGFESALIEAASRPDSDSRLGGVVEAAKQIVSKVNGLSDAVQVERLAAEQEIGRQVDLLNTSLSQVEDLNNKIRLQIAAGHDPLGLMDERQVIVDRVTSIVPVTAVDRSHGQIALISEGGAVLLDGKSAELQFSSVGVIVPEMSVASGALAQVQVNGQPIDTSSRHNVLRGGSLEALFHIRDETAVEAQANLDGVARDLISRFSDPTIDPTLSAGSPGLFTEAGSVVHTPALPGTAQRLELNAVVDPELGGETWRIRAGIGAPDPGAAGDAGHILALSEVLSAPRASDITSVEQDVFGLANHLLSLTGTARQSADAELSHSVAKRDAVLTAELEGGVDIDAELQKLLMIENAYAANARVIETVDEMLDQLMRI